MVDENVGLDLKKVMCYNIVRLVLKSNFLTQTLIEACAAADGLFYVFQQQQYCTTGRIFTRRKPYYSVIVAHPGIQRTSWSIIYGSGSRMIFHNLIKEFQVRCVIP